MLFLDLLLLALAVLVCIHPSILSSLPADKHQPRDVITNSVYIGLVALRVIVYVAVTLVVAVLGTDASYVGVLSPIMQKPQGPASNSAPAKLIDTLTIPKPSSTQPPVDETLDPKAAVDTKETAAPVKEPEPIVQPEQTIDTAPEPIVPKEEAKEEAAVIEPTVVVKQTPIPIVPREEKAAKESIAPPVSQPTTASETTQDVNTSPVSFSEKSAASVHSNSSHVDSSEEHSDDTEMTSDASETSKQPSTNKPSMAEVVALDDAPATSAASSVHTAASNGSRLARLAGKVSPQQPKPQPSQSKQRRSIIPLRTSSLMRRDRQPKPENEGTPVVHKTLSMRLPKAANIFHNNNNQQHETTKAPRPFFTLGRRSKVPEPPADPDTNHKPKSRLTPRKRISNLFHQQ